MIHTRGTRCEPEYRLNAAFQVVGVVQYILAVSSSDHSRRMQLKRLSVFLRILFLLGLVLALVNPTIRWSSHRPWVVVLLDQSRSIAPSAQKKAKKFFRDLHSALSDGAAKKAQLLILPFAATPRPTVTWEQFREQIQSTDFLKRLEIGRTWQNDTNIALALQSALAQIPPHFVPHVLLLSDGNETQGDILRVAAQTGVPISTIPLANSEPEIVLDEFRLPSRVWQGEPFMLRVVVQSNTNTAALLRVSRGSIDIFERPVSLSEGTNEFTFDQTLDAQGLQEFSVDVTAQDDTIGENNQASAVLMVEQKPRILILDTEPQTLRELVSALRVHNIIAEVRPADEVPQTLTELNQFDAIVLSSVPAVALSEHQTSLLRTYLSNLGGGLVMLGGEHSFGLGGYANTPLEDILPIRCDVEKERDRPSIAMCLVIDRSASMTGKNLELAKAVATSTVEGVSDRLSPQDYLGVVAFDYVAHVVYPIQKVATSANAVDDFSSLQSAGGTRLMAGLASANEQLQNVPAQIKHVILLTDGHSEPSDWEPLLQQMTQNQITVSTVGVAGANFESAASGRAGGG